MFTNLTDRSKAFVFYAIAFVLGLGAALLPGASTSLYMFTPVAAMLLTMLVVTRDGYTRAGWARLGLHRPGLRAWITAMLVPLLVMGVAYAIIWGSGLARLVVPADIEGMPVAYLPIIIVVSLVTSTLTVSLGEELGWRGYLLPHLATLGRWWAALLSGLLHGLWHLPLMLLTSLYHPEGERAIVIPLFLLTLTIAGVFFAYLRFASDSVWPATLAHSAHNLFWALFSMFTSASSPLIVEYLAGDSGILIAAGYALAATVLMARLTRRAPQGSQLQGQAAEAGAH